jgi:hypothetical protein
VSVGRYRLVIALLVVCLLVLAMVFIPFAWRVAPRAAVRMPATPTPPPAPVVVPPQPTVVTTISEYDASRSQSLLAWSDYTEYEPPADLVVYEEDPVAARKLLAQGENRFREVHAPQIEWQFRGAFQQPVYQNTPADVGAVPPFVQHDPNQNRSTLFVHGLTSPAGNRRLVFLDLHLHVTGTREGARAGIEYKMLVSRKLGFRVYNAPGTGGDGPTQLREGTSFTVRTPGADVVPIRWTEGVLKEDRAPGAALRFFAGRADPKDASHFTVDYEYAGVRGTIDGWLTDDDFLRLRPRGGKTEGGTWHVAGGEGGKTAIEK